jgi:predicted secreted Zn-dependent protease
MNCRSWLLLIFLVATACVPSPEAIATQTVHAETVIVGVTSTKTQTVTLTTTQTPAVVATVTSKPAVTRSAVSSPTPRLATVTKATDTRAATATKKPPVQTTAAPPTPAITTALPAPSLSPRTIRLGIGEFPIPTPSLDWSPLGTYQGRSSPVRYAETRLVYNYYDINASNVADITSQMVAQAICDDNTGQCGYPAKGEAYIWLNYTNRRRSDGICIVTGGQVRVTGKVTLPRWSGGREQADAGLVHYWDERYNPAVHVHEEGHVWLVWRWGRWLADVVNNLPPYPNCPELDAKVQEMSNLAGASGPTYGPQYDNITNHGASQGGMWPP